jgi:hypothetical protein
MAGGYSIEPNSGGGSTSFSLIAIAGGTATIPANNSAQVNSYMVADASFTLAITNPAEGGTYVLDITKTDPADITVTLPATSSPATVVLSGADNSLFQLVITYDKFDDGSGTPIYRYVVTSFAL